MEAIAENFEWLMQAAQAEWDVAAKPDKRAIGDDDTLPQLANPCKYQRTDSGKLNIMCYYRQQGLWKKKTPGAVGVQLDKDNSSFDAIVRRCETDVLDFYKSHHEAGGQGDHVDQSLPAITL